jgi:hypothetical protein
VRLSFHPVDAARERAASDAEGFAEEFEGSSFLLINAEFFRPHFRELPHTLDTQEGGPIADMIDNEGVLVRIPREAGPETRFKLGRGEGNHLALGAASVSRDHLEIWYEDDGLRVASLETRNGTSLRGKALEPGSSYVVGHGDVLRVGSIAVGFLSGDQLGAWLLQGR